VSNNPGGYDVGAVLDVVAELAGGAHECVSTIARGLAATWEARRERRHAEWAASLEEFKAEQAEVWQAWRERAEDLAE
jgi:hypothetical protein